MYMWKALLNVTKMRQEPVLVSSRIVNGYPDATQDMNYKRDDDLSLLLTSYFKTNELRNNFDQITEGFKKSIFEAILKSGNCMIPCFNVVCEENDEVKGNFAIIDIGGSTLRVSIVKFYGDRQAECTINKSWLIEDQNKNLDHKFFQWVAENFKSVVPADIIESLKNSRGNIKLGITWSFPINQTTSPNRGNISDLGKGFSVIDEFKEKDMKDIFEESFAKVAIPVEVYSIVNDSTSVLITGSYFKNAKLGLVQGTGVNSCFLVDSCLLNDTKKNALPGNSDNKKILLNSEASFLGAHLKEYVTSADVKLNGLWDIMGDGSTLPPHLTTEAYGVFQPLEIMTSGRYIPEIVRLTVEKIIADGYESFEGGVPKGLEAEYSLTAECLSTLYQCENLESFQSALNKKFPAKGLKIQDLNNLKIITKVIILRASIILASYIIALLEVSGTTNIPNADIAVVGSMLEHFPKYKSKVLEILDVETKARGLPKVTFNFIKDSSIYGASIAAYVNQKKMSLD